MDPSACGCPAEAVSGSIVVSFVFARRVCSMPIRLPGAILGSFLLFSSGAFGQTGLVAAYSFDEGTGTTAGDSSGNGNTGTIANATWAAAGKYGKALSFNGTNARVSIPSSASLNLTTGMTLEAWVNPSVSRASWGDIIWKADALYFLEGTSTNGGRPAGGAKNASGTWTDAYGPSALPVNTWTHLAATYDGSFVRLYVNGIQVTATARTGNLLSSTQPLFIGGNTLYGYYFAGMIDDVRVYNRALTQTEIQNDMNRPVAGAAPPLSSCDLNGDSVVNSADVTLAVDMTIGAAPCTATLVGANVCNAALVQQIVNSALGGPCGTAGTPAPPVARTVTLTWTASVSSGVTGYRVFRGTVSGGPYTQITPSPVTGVSYVDATVESGRTYYYVVTAVDAAGNQSVYSNQATAAVPGS